MEKQRKLPLAAPLLICLFLFGCGGSPSTHPPADDIKPGPGLFSGKDGVFTLISTGKENGEERKGDDTTER